jgi:hypothetical protein
MRRMVSGSIQLKNGGCLSLPSANLTLCRSGVPISRDLHPPEMSILAASPPNDRRVSDPLLSRLGLLTCA